jgi:acyl-CoA thioesterase FadM
MGVAHHTHYFVWFELGRTELMREAGCAYGALEDDDGVFRGRAGAEYLAPARYDEAPRSRRASPGRRVRARFDTSAERAMRVSLRRVHGIVAVTKACPAAESR